MDNLTLVSGVTVGLIVGDLLGTTRPLGEDGRANSSMAGYILAGLIAYGLLEWLT